MSNKKWTIYIKSIREDSRYTLRGAAREMNISAPYLHDVEVGNRAPTKKLVDSLIKLYKLDEEGRRTIYDAAAEVNDTIPYDVEEFLKDYPEAMQTVIEMMNEKKHQLKKKTNEENPQIQKIKR